VQPSSQNRHVTLAGRVFPVSDLLPALRSREQRATAALVEALRHDAASGRPTHQALGIALEAFGPGVRLYLARIPQLDGHERESAYLDVFLRVAREIDRFDPAVAPFAAWILGLTRSAALGQYEPHRKRRRQELAHRDRCLEVGRRLRVGPDVDGERVVAAIRLLSPLKQRVLYGRAVLDRSFAELADAERRGLAAVERLYYRALREVRSNYARLQSEGGEL
jgi:DNA-directed RNA polymerase specialized sigma24 family protein